MKLKFTVISTAITSIAIGQISISSFSSKVDFNAGGKPFAIVIADIDNDSKNDVVVSNFDDNNISVYLNQETSGTISSSSLATRVNFAAGTNPRTVTVGDLDGDSLQDVVVANESGAMISVLRNTSVVGTISFAAKQDLSVGTGNVSSVELADIDGDGKLDIIASVFTSNKVSIFRNTSSKGSITTDSRVDLTPTGGVYVRELAIGDLNGDSTLDIVATDDGASKVFIYQNNSTPGTISANSFNSAVTVSTAVGCYAVAIEDMDKDGKNDLLVNLTSANQLGVFINQIGTGTIAQTFFGTAVNFTSGNTPYYGLITSDLDLDGDKDVAVANVGGTISIFENVFTGTLFTTSSLNAKVDLTAGAYSTYCTVGDLDGDGMPDIATNSVLSNKLSIYRNLLVPTNMIENITSEQFILFPNPSSTFVHLNSSKAFQTINVYNQFGQKVNVEISKDYIDVSSLPNGLYYIELYLDGKTKNLKLVKN